MPLSPTFALFLLFAPEPGVDTKFVQVAPAMKTVTPVRSPGQTRAVVLIHGFRPHPISGANPLRADISGWEEPNSALVKALARESDVFAFGYAQHLPVEEVTRSPALGWHVAALRQAGYTEVVLIGYSAGALLARYHVEDHPGDGVTKVIQVCPPNGGTNWGKFTAGVRQTQEPFLLSLTKESRQAAMRDRAGKRLPPTLEFVCVVGVLGRAGDGLVRFDCQWPRDLQQQGVPAVLLHTAHISAMHSKAVAAKLAELAREPQPRWTAAQVEAARPKILGREMSDGSR
jgi:pimeloyl-ACP methyl ester carboxylesterase